MKRLLLAAVAACGLAVPAVAADPKDERFDKTVREDIFAGLNGDKEALARGMKLCEEALKKDPKHAEALVWHGAGLTMEARIAFADKDFKKGLPLWQKALAELDEAVKLSPDSYGTRVPRALIYVAASRAVPDEKQKKDLADKAWDDLQWLLKQHKDDFAEISSHRRGELLFGLAEMSRRRGEEKEATEFLKKIVELEKDGKYGKEATAWLKDTKKMEHNCIGCHTGKK